MRDGTRHRGGRTARAGLAAALLGLAPWPAGAQTPAEQAPPAATEPADRLPAACRAGIDAGARAAGLDPARVAARLDGLAPDPAILAATGAQAEFVRPIWAYIDAAVTEARVADGQARLRDLAPTFAALEERYGVDRHILAAFWGVESNYGGGMGEAPVLRSLATLACGDGARAGYWRDELVAALRIAEAGDGPDPLLGSWAGAMGHTQFMPSVYLAHAVDFDGDGRRDIWRSAPDALASTAQYLRASGWRPGEGWGQEVALPAGFDYALADETTERSLAEWAGLGLRPARGERFADAEAQAVLILPAGARGPAFLLRPNFRAILRYNTALAYALTVGHLADRLRGEPGFSRDWPRGDRALTVFEIRDLQTRLSERGHAAGSADGKIGPRTRAAIRAWQATIGLTPDGYADPALLERIRAER
ncbi:Tn3 family transposase TnXax1 [Methylobacterium hispanicum]|uniref:Tn3 family transposase TnXax1 n=1 Tax=Methylobacterium hispanicum TaxID=270350 RepID=A0AAV4ZVY6_9HYPH|nr:MULTISPECIES: lytic murein transglycosylase [Methylobacterium]GJD92278.1 Tn3 family transposase TnXax1 [Methylobacterium hispanicum]